MGMSQNPGTLVKPKMVMFIPSNTYPILSPYHHHCQRQRQRHRHP